MPIEYQSDADHYFDRLAQMQMSDSLASRKENFEINGVSIVKGTENNETRLNEMIVVSN